MIINFKKLDENAVRPSYAKPGDAGLDLTAVSKRYDADGNVIYGTGIAVELPRGCLGLLMPRSSLTKQALLLGNHVGLLDSGYRGEITFVFKKYQNEVNYKEYSVGDRIGQLVIIPYPEVNLQETTELTQSERGTGGFGSTGS